MVCLRLQFCLNNDTGVLHGWVRGISAASTRSSLQEKQEREHTMCISIALHTWLREEGWVRWLVHELWIYRILDDGVGATLVVDNVQWTPLAPLVDIVTRTACCSDHWSATAVCYPSHHNLGSHHDSVMITWFTCRLLGWQNYSASSAWHRHSTGSQDQHLPPQHHWAASQSSTSG